MFDAVFRRHGLQTVVLNFKFMRCSYVFKRLSHTESSLVESQVKIKTLVEADRQRSKQKFQKHFIENLFLNKFQNTILEYPELPSLKEVETLQKHYKLAENLLTAGTGKNEIVSLKDSDGVVSTIKKFELSGFKLPKRLNGFGYLQSEYTFLQEALSEDCSLSKTVSENEDFGIQLINLYGNISQKETYLPKLASGENMACFAHLESEPLVRLDPIKLKTTATLSPDGVSYIISGKKNWVYNASYADIIIFSAAVYNSEDEKWYPTLFLVDKNTKGIQIHEPIKKIGLKGVEVNEISFNDVVIPKTYVLGSIYEGDMLIKKLLVNGKLNVGVQCIKIMKKCINTVIKHCLENKLFKKNLYKREYYQAAIGQMIAYLYTVESMTYLVSGRMDMFEDADVFLESLIVKIHASENANYVLQQTLSILGVKVFEDIDNIDEIINNIHFFASSEDPNDHLRVVLSTAGCKHVLKFRKEASLWKRFRNYATKQRFAPHIWGTHENMNLSNELEGYLHLMFEDESLFLENSVFKLHSSTNYLLRKYNEKIFEKHVELKMLADMLINIYTMTAALARASRAYCLAVPNQETDRAIIWADMVRLHHEIMSIHFSFKDYYKIQKSKKINFFPDIKSFVENHPVLPQLSAKNK